MPLPKYVKQAHNTLHRFMGGFEKLITTPAMLPLPPFLDKVGDSASSWLGVFGVCQPLGGAVYASAGVCGPAGVMANSFVFEGPENLESSISVYDGLDLAVGGELILLSADLVSMPAAKRRGSMVGNKRMIRDRNHRRRIEWRERWRTIAMAYLLIQYPSSANNERRFKRPGQSLLVVKLEVTLEGVA